MPIIYSIFVAFVILRLGLSRAFLFTNLISVSEFLFLLWWFQSFQNISKNLCEQKTYNTNEKIWKEIGVNVCNMTVNESAELNGMNKEATIKI